MSRPQPGLLLGCLLSPMPRVRSVHCTPPHPHTHPSCMQGCKSVCYHGYVLPQGSGATDYQQRCLLSPELGAQEGLDMEPRKRHMHGTDVLYIHVTSTLYIPHILHTHHIHTKHTPHTCTRGTCASTPHIYTPRYTLYIPATHPINTRRAHTLMPAPTRDPDTGCCALGTSLPAATLKGSAAAGSHLGPRTRSRVVLPCPL